MNIEEDLPPSVSQTFRFPCISTCRWTCILMRLELSRFSPIMNTSLTELMGESGSVTPDLIKGARVRRRSE